MASALWHQTKNMQLRLSSLDGFLSKLVAMVRIENFESRNSFEKRNLLKSRAAPMTSKGFSITLVLENHGAVWSTV
jgi:hypothetical protein